VTGRTALIEAPRRRSVFLKWRDRGLTLVLWSFWSRPVDAITRLAAGPVGPDGAPAWDSFLRDLTDASSAAGVLIVLLYAWGGYDRLRPRGTSRILRD
jgi:hypothetical protein